MIPHCNFRMAGFLAAVAKIAYVIVLHGCILQKRVIKYTVVLRFFYIIILIQMVSSGITSGRFHILQVLRL